MKTVRVRIAVAVDEHGNYHAAGWSGSKDEHIGETASEFFESAEGAEAVHFVEADVPLPESQTIQGESCGTLTAE